MLEFDIHDNDYAAIGDYRLGHDSPGHEVYHDGGNPTSNNLAEWLGQIAWWRAQNPTAAPITVALDLKDQLDDNPSYRDGNIAALNQRLQDVFPTLLFPDQLPAAWPAVTDLQGRVLVVLTGDHATRVAYRRDRGYNPAVAMNTSGKVVEVHDSGSGSLWYWTGK